MKCHYCGERKETRPYGPNGEDICFDCAFATPERAKETEAAFNSIINGIEGPVVIDGSEVGIMPLSHYAAVKRITRYDDEA